jgi:hypothetical protein
MCGDFRGKKAMWLAWKVNEVLPINNLNHSLIRPVSFGSGSSWQIFHVARHSSTKDAHRSGFVTAVGDGCFISRVVRANVLGNIAYVYIHLRYSGLVGNGPSSYFREDVGCSELKPAYTYTELQTEFILK